MPSNESTSEDISQDLIKEYAIKNELLTQQVKEYKTLVGSLEHRISELAEKNQELSRIADDRVRKKVGKIKQVDKDHGLAKELALSLITEESHSEQVMELTEVWSIISMENSKKIDL